MRSTGSAWEQAASAHLQRAGLKLLTRNFNRRVGEIDLVMRDGDCIVFVEVRYRGNTAQGGAPASVGPAKRTKLLRAAALYLQAHPALHDAPCRVDVVACSGTPVRPAFDWIRAAFEAQ